MSDQEWERLKTTFQKGERPMPDVVKRVIRRARSDRRRALVGLGAVYVILVGTVASKVPALLRAGTRADIAEFADYPWGSTDPGMASQYAIYSCYYPSAGAGCTGVANIARVGTASQGAALWGQLDMAGELWEWGLDFSSSSYLNPCVDCAYLTLGNGPGILRGGDFGQYAGFGSSLRASHRTDSLGGFHAGFRCARTP